MCLFFNAEVNPEIYTLSLHDALPIFVLGMMGLQRKQLFRGLYKNFPQVAFGIWRNRHALAGWRCCKSLRVPRSSFAWAGLDRKSTRLNSSHQIISYAVFCLKKRMELK